MSECVRDVLEGLSGYTPGPWRDDQRSGVVAVFKDGDERNCLAGARDGAIHYNDSGAEYVEDPHGHWTLPEGVRANARLIARAPELVEEIRGLREALRDTLSALNYVVTTDFPDRRYGVGWDRIERHRALLPDPPETRTEGEG